MASTAASPVETLNIPRIPPFILKGTSTLKGTNSHDASCIMSVQERVALMVPEHAIVTNEPVEKRIALPAGGMIFSKE